MYKEGDLRKEATCAKSAQVQIESGSDVKRSFEYCNLAPNISVDYLEK